MQVYLFDFPVGSVHSFGPLPRFQMALFRQGDAIPNTECPECHGRVEVVAEHSPVQPDETGPTQRYYMVKCRECGRRFVYDIRSGTLTP